MILRRNDNAIADAAGEFADVIWYDRKLVFLANLKDGSETIDPGIYEGMLKAMKRTEKKYEKEASELLPQRLRVGHVERQALSASMGAWRRLGHARYLVADLFTII